MEKNLHSSLKDYIHSLVNQNIILAKISNANGWKQQIAEQGKNQRKQIDSKNRKRNSPRTKLHYKKILMPHLSKHFPEELFTRCI